MSNVKAKTEVEVSDKAFKLAEEWVKNMSNGSGGNEEVEGYEQTLDIRPSRLGLGAKFVPHSNLTASVTPIEKKLRAKLQASETSKDVIPHDHRWIDKSGKASIERDDSDGEEDSKSSHFTKKDTSKSSKACLIQEFQKGKNKKKRKMG